MTPVVCSHRMNAQRGVMAAAQPPHYGRRPRARADALFARTFGQRAWGRRKDWCMYDN